MAQQALNILTLILRAQARSSLIPITSFLFWPTHGVGDKSDLSSMSTLKCTSLNLSGLSPFCVFFYFLTRRREKDTFDFAGFEPGLSASQVSNPSTWPKPQQQGVELVHRKVFILACFKQSRNFQHFVYVKRREIIARDLQTHSPF